jgi:hypothetical protein
MFESGKRVRIEGAAPRQPHLPADGPEQLQLQEMFDIGLCHCQKHHCTVATSSHIAQASMMAAGKAVYGFQHWSAPD